MALLYRYVLLLGHYAVYVHWKEECFWWGTKSWIFHIITQTWCSRAIQAAGNPYRRAASHSVMHRLVFYCERNRSQLLSLECSGKGRQLREKAMNRMSRLITNAMAGFYHSRACTSSEPCYLLHIIPPVSFPNFFLFTATVTWRFKMWVCLM